MRGLVVQADDAVPLVFHKRISVGQNRFTLDYLRPFLSSTATQTILALSKKAGSMTT